MKSASKPCIVNKSTTKCRKKNKNSNVNKEKLLSQDNAHIVKKLKDVISKPEKLSRKKSTNTFSDGSSETSEPPDNILSGEFTIMVHNLHVLATKEEVNAYFLKFGDVKASYVPKHANGVWIKGYGYIQYFNKESFDSALKSKHKLHKNVLRVEAATADMQRTQENKKQDGDTHSIRPDKSLTQLFVTRLSKTMTKPVLEKHFSKYGKVLKVLLPEDIESSYSGFAFVVYETEEDALRALKNSNHVIKKEKVSVVPGMKPVEEARPLVTDTLQ